MNKVVIRAALLGLALSGSTLGQGAFAAIPQSGLWIVDAEADGKPGRGFNIDLQKDTLVLAYYGYASSGAPTFFLASGPLDAAGNFQAGLFDYQGGMSLGGAHKSATVNASPGNVRISFATPTAGTITFPGEAQKSISRFSFADSSANFNRSFKGSYVTYPIAFPLGGDSSTLTFSVGNGVLTLNRTGFFNGTCMYTGTYSLAGAGLASSGTYRCADFSEGTYRAENLTVDGNGIYNGVFFRKSAGSTIEIKEVHWGS